MSFKIVLCCINLKENVQTVNELTLYQIFSKVSRVKNIKIFNRSKDIKAFIEINEESVDDCIRQIHRKATEVGKIAVYLSHKHNILFDKDLSSTLCECLESINTDEDSKSQKLKNIDINIKDPIFFVNKTSEDSSEDKTVNNADFDHRLSSCQRENVFMRETGKDKKPEGVCMPNEHSASVNFVPLKKANGFIKLDMNYEDNRILLIKNLNSKTITCMVLANLFGCYGNTRQIFILTARKEGYVEMENEAQARAAIRYLNHCLLFDNILKIEITKTNIVTSFIKSSKKEDIEHLVYKEKYYRYKEGLKIKVNKPSKILHITSLSPQFDLYKLYQFVCKLHEPIQIIKLEKTGTSSSMYLVEFAHMSHAMEVLAMYHNVKIYDKLLKISFSHTELKTK